MAEENFRIANSMDRGSIDDHVLVHQKCGHMLESGHKGSAEACEFKWRVLCQAGFHVGPIPTVNYEGSFSMLEDGARYHEAAAYSTRR